MSEFARDTALELLEPGRFEALLRPGWWIARGANGGYLAALLIRAMGSAAGGLPARSVTIHYTGAPEAGPVAIVAETLRRGRSLQTLRAEMNQDGRLIAVAMGAFAEERPGPAFQTRVPPTAPPPDACPLFEGLRPIHQRWEYRWVYGAPPGGNTEHAIAGGWIRSVEPTVADPAYVAAVCDAFSPPYFATVSQDEIAPIPTVELTIHFRRRLPHRSLKQGDYLLTRFESRSAAEGFIDETGEVWTGDGLLLAECRQLSTFLKASGAA